MNKRLSTNFPKWINTFLPDIVSFEKYMKLQYKETILNFLTLYKKNRKKAVDDLTENVNNNFSRGLDLANKLLEKH